MTEQHETRLAAILNDAMQAQGVSIRDLARAVGVTYEHIRRMVRGVSNPSKPVLKVMCQVLSLDENELMQYADADALERKYGDVPALMAGKNPELSLIERYWTNLLPDQKDELTNLAREWSQKNRTLTA